MEGTRHEEERKSGSVAYRTVFLAAGLLVPAFCSASCSRCCSPC